MSKWLIVISIVVLIGGAVLIASIQRANHTLPQPTPSIQFLKEVNNMHLTSPVFQNNHLIPAKHTCDGDDVNPPLQIGDAPIGIKSFALIVDDPDAPRGDWVHWLVWNIKPDIREIGQRSVPAGAIEGTTDFGRTGWGGPCPPSGTHRYFFKLYALDTMLDLPPSSRKKDLESAAEGHVIEKAELIGLYQRI